MCTWLLVSLSLSLAPHIVTGFSYEALPWCLNLVLTIAKDSDLSSVPSTNHGDNRALKIRVSQVSGRLGSGTVGQLEGGQPRLGDITQAFWDPELALALESLAGNGRSILSCLTGSNTTHWGFKVLLRFYLFLFFVSECVSKYRSVHPECLQRPEEDIKVPGPGVTDGSEPLCER